jgi:hypothetical protein
VKVLDAASARSARIRRARITCAIKNAKRLIEFPFGPFISMIFLAIPSMRNGTSFGGDGTLVSKHRDRPYRGGRQKHWIKVKNRQHPAMVRVLDSYR